MPVQLQSKLIKKEQLKPDIFKFSLSAKEITDIAKPGQFIEIRVTDGLDPFLRRPISIYNIDKENGILEIIFRVQGKGTEFLSRKKEEDLIDIIGPLGYGTFKFEGYKNIAILGGGIGVFPLYELAKEASKSATVNTYLGFRNKEAVVLEEEFEKVSNKLVITTDDGSYKMHGFAINELKKDDLLIFQKDIDIINNKIYIISYNKEQVILGRVFDNMLFFDNGMPPVDISNKDQYCVLGRLIRVERYFN